MIKTSKKIQFKVSITGHSQDVPDPEPNEKNPSNKKVTFYTISITSPIRNWKVKHRYSDFYALHEKLSKCYTKLPKVPGKTFFAVTSESKIEKRQQELERYLNDLVELDLLMSNVYSCQFFQIEEHFPEYFCRPPEVLVEYETLRSLTFTDVHYEPGRIVNYLLCSKGIERPLNSVKSKGDPNLATGAEGLSKSLLNGFKFNEFETSKLFHDKKVVKSFDMKAHCMQYFTEASILVAGFSQGIISVYKEEKKNKLDDEYQLSGVTKLKVSSDRVTKILVNTSKGEMFIFGRKNQVKIVDMAIWEVKDTFKIGTSTIYSPVIDEDHELGLSTTDEGELLVWNITPAHPVVAQKLVVSQGSKIRLMDCDLDAGKVLCVADGTGEIYLIDIDFPFNYESNFKVMNSCKGFANPTCIKYCKKRKEVFIGYVDGTISVYQLIQNLEQIQYTGSFRIHRDAIHSLYFFPDLDLFASSGFDSVLKLWKAPDEWNKKITVTASMIGGMKEDNLSTIKEEEKDDLELPSHDSNSNMLKHRITAWGAGPGDKVVESLLQQM